MPTLIIEYFQPLCVFLMPVIEQLSRPQQRHMLNLISALLVCTCKHKTLATLTRLLRVEHADQYAAADFFRVSDWDETIVSSKVLVAMMKAVAAVQAKTGWRLIFLSTDDSLCCKDIGTDALEAVAFQHDHVKQRQQWKEYTKAACVVTLVLHMGPFSLPVAHRLYLKQKQVRRLNRSRDDGLRLMFVSKPDLARQMLEQIYPYLPKGSQVWVLFDSWYASNELLKWIRSCGWHFVCAVKSNRKVGRYQVSQWWTHLGHQSVVTIKPRQTPGSPTYLTRRAVGKLPRYGHEVVAILSKRHRKAKGLAYFICSDVRLTTHTIMKYYAHRWDCEIDNRFLKQQLGLADFRLHSVEATQRWFALVFAAYAFVCVRKIDSWLALPNATAAQVMSTHAVMDEHQCSHFKSLVCHVAALARAGSSDHDILTQLLPT